MTTRVEAVTAKSKGAEGQKSMVVTAPTWLWWGERETGRGKREREREKRERRDRERERREREEREKRERLLATFSQPSSRG